MLCAIHLHNFKCWAHEDVPLGALTLVTGLNGSGKSTLLQSLLVLRQSYDQRLLPGRLAINGELVTLGTGRDAFCEQAEDDELGLGLSWSDGERREWRFTYDQAADVLEAPGDGTGEQAPELQLDLPPFGGEVFHLSAERIGPRVATEVSDFRVRVKREIGSKGELAGHFLGMHGDKAMGVAALAHPDVASLQLVHQVEAWLGEISPGTRLHVGQHRELDAVQIRYSFSGPAGGTNEYRATNVGFGLSYTLPILVATLAARPGALLVVENPEAHLHPRGQVRIAELLARAAANGVQVLIETHSDHVLNGIRLAVHGGVLAPDQTCIHFFERRASETGSQARRVSPQMDQDGRLEPWPAGFFDEFDLSLSRLLGPSKRP